ncbi:winged helix-turn-helix domain-containing protein [Pseudorhodobacter aquimaris]|uniref:winged helix-turn-helix domain-containing protein n=1 Tax=Pseudorhodobacter aquimaris TaxID=687412 RepID=UPI000A913EF2|nr:LysR family transcriptional regulator [Pseudorhodobacter aquimaris]
MPETRLRLRLHFGPASMFGPGRADLLEAIAEHGSISAAGRKTGMSYRRAWSLVEALNSGFKTPLVDSSRGGSAGGGARLTETGIAVLAHFRNLEAILAKAGAQDIEALQSLAVDMHDGK